MVPIQSLNYEFTFIKDWVVYYFLFVSDQPSLHQLIYVRSRRDEPLEEAHEINPPSYCTVRV